MSKAPRQILWSAWAAALLPLSSTPGALAAQDGPEILELGGQRELFVDSYAIETLTGQARRVLQRPTAREIAVVHDAPWEGNVCCYHTVFRDGAVVRMYYRGAHSPDNADTMKEDHPELTCYAESADGITWTKPNLGLFEFGGSTDNNIIWMGPGTHNFSPFRDTNPACAPEAAYKALALGEGGLLALASPDAIHWALLHETPVITEGAFDSQNLAFWDPVRKCYVDYHRGFTDGVRAIMTSTSPDFITWTDPVWVQYPEGTPHEHLYTNQILPYARAPRFKVGFPKRFEAQRTAPGNRMPGLSDGVFMSSRDGVLFERWLEAFVRPGPQRERWVNRNNMTAWGLVQTSSTIPGCPDDLSIYSTEGYYTGDSCAIRRYSLRLDGFVSVQAPMAGGELITKPLVFSLPDSAEVAPAVVTRSPGPVEFERQAPLRGKTSLRFREPAIVRIPGTTDMGPRVTFAMLVQGIPNGHRRLLSAYNGGAINPGDRELVFDVFSEPEGEEDALLRFMYDGLVVSAGPETLPDWGEIGRGEMPCHVALTWDDGLVRLYFQGRCVARGGSAGKGSLTLALGDVLFGEDYPPTSLENEPFLGVLDDLLVLHRALSDEEVVRLATAGAGFLQEDAAGGVLYTMEKDEGNGLSDDLTADGAGDAVIDAPRSVHAGDCQLLLNVATSAAGSVRVELQDADGTPIEGYALADCDPVFGDDIERPVSWRRSSEVSPLAGRPVRLRFELRDADLFAFRFGRPETLAAHP